MDEAATLINELHVCDPAVGSGHFLFSVLNKFIAVKDRMDLLTDEHGSLIRDLHIEVYDGKADLYTYFIERGIQLLWPGYLFCYIVTNKWKRRVRPKST